MLLRQLARAAASVAFVLAIGGPALAQGKGGNIPPGYDPSKMPKPDEIRKRAQEFLQRAETATAELEGFAKLTYKAVPSSTEEIGKQIGEQYKGQLPQGVDIDAALRQFGPQIEEAFNTYLSEPEGWKFEALVELKWKSKKIPKGEYKVSLEVEGEQLVRMILTQGERENKKTFVAIPLHFGVEKKQQEPFAKLKFEFKDVKDKKTEKVTGVDLRAEFFRSIVKLKEPFKVVETKDAKKDEKKEEKKEEGEKK